MDSIISLHDTSGIHFQWSYYFNIASNIVHDSIFDYLSLNMKMFTATRWQAVTYLLGVCLFSIAFLVFLNSSVSFVITTLIKEKTHVGDAVGSLGFADEVLAIVACPFWGVISDRLGVRIVSTRAFCLPPRPISFDPIRPQSIADYIQRSVLWGTL